MRIITKIFLLTALMALIMPASISAQENDARFWNVQSIDTVKYSRDVAREKLNSTSFDKVIDAQVKAIADTGATHISIGTPYDEEFLPFLKRWVSSSRKYGLKVWFRGNWSGWEKWFDYSRISREDHIAKTEKFILNNPDLFKDGDVFTACPECENGGPGDPRITRDIDGYRKFLIREHGVMSRAFQKIDRKVTYNYNSMNGDVAFLIMNKETTDALGGIITIDHYVKTQKRLVSDIQKLSKQGGGAKIVLGEIGVPIPDIHGNMTSIDQAKWMQDTLSEIAKMPEVEGINYWTNIGGSTELWSSKMIAKPVSGVLTDFYKPKFILGRVLDGSKKPIENAVVTNEYGSVETDKNGSFRIIYISYLETNLNFSKDQYHSQEIQISSYDGKNIEISLKKIEDGFTFRFLRTIRQMATILTSLF